LTEKSKLDIRLEKRKKELKDQKVQGHYKLAPDEEWVQQGHGKVAKKSKSYKKMMVIVNKMLEEDKT